MQVFLGDQVTLVNDKQDEENPTFVTGQVSGIVLDGNKKVHRIYIHNITDAFYMFDGWKFVEDFDAEADDE
jgi:hypothetical protein